MSATLQRLWLAILMVCALASESKGQYQSYFIQNYNDVPRTFYGGFAVGINASQVDGDLRSGYHRVGLNAGPLVYARFSDRTGASMELLFAQKGSVSRNVTETVLGTAVESYDIRLNYVEVPVLFHYFSPGRLHYGAGLSYAYLIGSKEEAYDYNGKLNLHPEVTYFRRRDLSWMAELAYEFYKGSFLSIRYNYSLLSIREAARIPQNFGGGYSPGQYNNVFSLRLVCLFR